MNHALKQKNKLILTGNKKAQYFAEENVKSILSCEISPVFNVFVNTLTSNGVNKIPRYATVDNF